MRAKIILLAILFLVFIDKQLYSQGLKPGDGIRISFLNITDDISGDYFSQLDGGIQLPFIGIISTQGKTFEAIKSEIISKYDSLYRDPELTVQPLFKINLLGEVRTPGIYFVTGVEKLIDIIALAGGETSDADINDIYIIREETEIRINAEKIIQSGNTANDIGLKSGDRIYVPRKWWVGARNAGIIISAAAVIVTLISIFVR